MTVVKFVLYAPQQPERVVEHILDTIPRVGETVHLPAPDDYAWQVFAVSHDLSERGHVEIALRRD